jgi:hypothetical protein
MDYTAAWKELRSTVEEQLVPSQNTQEKKYGDLFIDLMYDMETKHTPKGK